MWPSRTNAIRCPSGDQAAVESSCSPSRSGFAGLPSCFAIQRSPWSETERVKTILSPSGAHAGSKSFTPLGGWVISSTLEPSACDTTIAKRLPTRRENVSHLPSPDQAGASLDRGAARQLAQTGPVDPDDVDARLRCAAPPRLAHAPERDRLVVRRQRGLRVVGAAPSGAEVIGSLPEPSSGSIAIVAVTKPVPSLSTEVRRMPSPSARPAGRVASASFPARRPARRCARRRGATRRIRRRRPRLVWPPRARACARFSPCSAFYTAGTDAVPRGYDRPAQRPEEDEWPG